MDPDPSSGRNSGPTMTDPKRSGDPAAIASHLESAPPRYPELSGKVALITGAARGIGQGIAFRLGHEGMSVVLADLDEESLRMSVDVMSERGMEAIGFTGDVSRREDIATMFETALDEFGTLDLLVNNAADLHRNRLLDDHEGILETQLATNVAGPYVCSQKAAQIMRGADGGSIVHISSVGADRAHERGLPYDVTKGAINAMTRAMAVDLGEYGIRVNAVGPGITHTHRTSEVAASRPLDAYVPLGRAGTVFDVAAVVAFLASSDAAYITGQVIYVDGGMLALLKEPGDFSDRESRRSSDPTEE